MNHGSLVILKLLKRNQHSSLIVLEMSMLDKLLLSQVLASVLSVTWLLKSTPLVRSMMVESVICQ